MGQHLDMGLLCAYFQIVFKKKIHIHMNHIHLQVIILMEIIMLYQNLEIQIVLMLLNMKFFKLYLHNPSFYF